ncbi:MAG: triose-phosphate isomerase [Candidatus Acidiferrales bacterium]
MTTQRKRRPVIAGNWKMYKTQADTHAFFAAFKPLVADATHAGIVIAPPFTSLPAAVEAAKGSAIAISAQNGFWQPEGAYTGEISMPMIADSGATHVIIGHSERRQYFGETDETVNKRLRAALAANLTPIVCIGESLEERENNHTHRCLSRQFEGGLGSLTPAEFSRILLAYEPVWAIGTGKTATPEMASSAHSYVRGLVADRFSAEQASAIRILYGGSVKPDNIKGLMAHEEIDGALVGGASLDAASFAAIVNFDR